MRAITLTAIIAGALAISNALPAAAWLKDLRSGGCHVDHKMKKAASIRWSGKCVDGRIHGPGRLEYMTRNMLTLWFVHLGPGRGLVAQNGRINSEQITPLVTEVSGPNGCNPRGRLLVMSVTVKPLVEVEDWRVRSAIYNHGLHVFRQRCNPRTGRVIVRVFRPSNGPPRMVAEGSAHAVKASRWHEGFRQAVNITRNREIKTHNQGVINLRRRQAVQRQKQLQALELEARKNRVNAIVGNVMKASRLVKGAAYAQNPFAFESETVAMIVKVDQMIARDRAIVRYFPRGALIIRGVPNPTTFHPGVQYLVSLRRPKTVQYGQMPTVASGRYVKSVSCKDIADCRDIRRAMPQ